MTLRDYFAGQWLVGAAQYWANTSHERLATLATEAFKLADAMLQARGKE